MCACCRARCALVPQCMSAASSCRPPMRFSEVMTQVLSEFMNCCEWCGRLACKQWQSSNMDQATCLVRFAHPLLACQTITAIGSVCKLTVLDIRGILI